MTVSEAAPIVFNLQAQPAGRDQWLATAARAEDAGFGALYVADHPGSASAPFVALAAAAAVTTTIRLGTYVANAGVWEPLALANEVATLDLISDGRAVFGIGAGHTPREWTDRGVEYPDAPARVTHMIEVAEATRSWLGRLDAPAPVQAPIPMLVGGNGRRLLGYAAEHADIVGITGLGRTRADGHDHEVEWSPAQIDERLSVLGALERPRVIDALVQIVDITDDRERRAAELAAAHDLRAAELLECPYALIGTAAQIADDLRDYRRRWGITAYTVRAHAIDAVAQIRAALSRK
jgi:probable F420-dependent oxidoreductase